MLLKSRNAVIYGGGAIGITAQIEKLLVTCCCNCRSNRSTRYGVNPFGLSSIRPLSFHRTRLAADLRSLIDFGTDCEKIDHV